MGGDHPDGKKFQTQTTEVEREVGKFTEAWREMSPSTCGMKKGPQCYAVRLQEHENVQRVTAGKWCAGLRDLQYWNVAEEIEPNQADRVCESTPQKGVKKKKKKRKNRESQNSLPSKIANWGLGKPYGERKGAKKTRIN